MRLLLLCLLLAGCSAPAPPTRKVTVETTIQIQGQPWKVSCEAEKGSYAVMAMEVTIEDLRLMYVRQEDRDQARRSGKR